VLHTLSKRLEHDIKDMMISNGDTKKARKRRDLQEPLQKARKEVLKEQLLREELFEEQKIRAETERAEEKARFLRTSRASRPFDEKIIIDEWLDPEDEDYVILRPYPGPDEIRIDPEQGRPEMYRRNGFQEAHLYRRRPDLDEMKMNQGRYQPGMQLRQRFQDDQWKLRARERQMGSGEERIPKQRHEFKLERKRSEEEKRRPRAEDTLQRGHGGHERLSRRPSVRVFADETHVPEADGLRSVPNPDGSKLDPFADRLGRERRQREEKERFSRERQSGSDQERLRTQQPEFEIKRPRFEEEKRPHADDKVKGKRREGRSEEEVTKHPDYHLHRKPDRSAREEEKSGREREYPGQHEEDEKMRRDRRKHVRDSGIYKGLPDWRKKSGGWSLF
jgi:hypothetical protein